MIYPIRITSAAWRDLEETPVYVRRFCLDLLAIKRRCMNERSNRPSPGGG